MSARRIEVCPDAVHLPGYLTLDAQRALAERCREMLANAEQRLGELAPAEPEGGGRRKFNAGAILPSSNEARRLAADAVHNGGIHCRSAGA